MKSCVCLLSAVDSYLHESSKQEIADEVLCVLAISSRYSYLQESSKQEIADEVLCVLAISSRMLSTGKK